MSRRTTRATGASLFGAAAGLAFLAGAFTMPWWAERWSQNWLIEFLYTLALAQGWNLLVPRHSSFDWLKVARLKWW